MKSDRRAIGFAMVALIFIMGACSGLQFWKSSSSDQTVPELSTCDSEPSALCIVSFGIDRGNRMLVNMLSPDPSLPSFYLKVQHGETSSRYECRASKNVPTGNYCTGEGVPLGNTVNIEVYSSDKDILLARGTFVIAALALPTLMVVAATPTSGTQTPISDLPSPTPTVAFQPGTITSTPILYPNP